MSHVYSRFEVVFYVERYFCIRKDGTVLSTQQGVFRMNCIDCLDRTNVVQGLLAKRMLLVQLIVSLNFKKIKIKNVFSTFFILIQKLGIVPEHESIENHKIFNNDFRNSELKII